MLLANPDINENADPWSLLTKAENRCKLGLFSEAVITADEAIQAALEAYIDKLDTPLPANREEALQILRGEGVKVSTESALRLTELRKKADRSAVNEDLSSSQAEEAISIAEKILTKIGERHTHHTVREKETEFMLPVNSLDPIQRFRPLHEGIAQVEPEFVTKLLLARAILNSKRKRIPHFIGLTVMMLSITTCALFGFIGGSGIIITFTGHSLFSIFGLLFDFSLLLIAYLFLKITLYVKGETR
jgi:hypothetical protein